jgi:lysophospholipase L1-like esterase
MPRSRTFLFVFFFVAACFALRATRAWAAPPLKVACTGTSAMAGLGSDPGHHVPDELNRALGAGFVVQNFAIDGATAISSISSSYAATSQMKAALAMNPDIVLFWFGGNDSFKATWDTHMGEFQGDYTNLVRTFQALPSHPKTFLVRLWAFVNTPVQQTVIAQQILPLIDAIAATTGSTLIDYKKAFENHPEYFPDGMHPNDTGTLAIGKFFADSVTAALTADMADGGTDGGPGDAAASEGATGNGEGGGFDAALPDDAPETEMQPAQPAPGPADAGIAASGNDATASASAGNATSGGGAGTNGGCQLGRTAKSGLALWPLVASVGVLVARRRRKRYARYVPYGRSR